MRPPSCILCGREGGATVVEGPSGRLVRCPGCGLVYLESPPSPDQLRDMYTSDEAASVDLAGQLRPTPKKTLAAAADLRLLRRQVEGGSLLEVGCGAGFFLDAARRAGFEVTGTEVNGRLVAFARERLGLEVLEGPVTETSLEGRHFDLAYMRNVLSHLPDPVATLAVVGAHLAEGAPLMLETGNFAELGDATLRRLERDRGLGMPDHMFFFSRRNVADLAATTGFRVERSIAYATGPHDALMAAAEGRVRGGMGTGAAPLRPTLKERVAGVVSYGLTYPVGRLLPHAGRPCTVKYVLRRAT